MKTWARLNLWTRLVIVLTGGFVMLFGSFGLMMSCWVPPSGALVSSRGNQSVFRGKQRGLGAVTRTV